MNTVASAERLARLETVLSVVLDISRRSAGCRDLREFFKAVHGEVGRIMYAKNFYIALRDGKNEAIRYAYDADEKDDSFEQDQLYPLLQGNESPTAWVIRNGKPLSVTAESFAQREAEGHIWGVGTDAEHWLGMPLIDGDGFTYGAVVIQSYTAGIRYSEEDVALFGLISNHVAHAIEQVQFTNRLERAIAERTSSLECEISERRRSETLQRALYEISALSVQAIELDVFYAELHRILGGLLYAKNLIITLYHEAENELSFPYLADEKDPAPPPGFRRPSGYGLSGFVLTTRKPQRIDQPRYQLLVEQGELHSAFGSVDFNSWIGAPMIYQERLLGVIILQSYDNKIEYSDDDLALLTFVADHIAAALSRKQSDESLLDKNFELQHALEHLHLAQDELVRKEKLASLGALVAGVAHEINTPIGVAITAASHLQDHVKRIMKLRQTEKLTAGHLANFEPMADESAAMILRNLKRADELVRSFKQVAVDQSSEQRRRFKLHEYMDEVLLSLQPKIKPKRHIISIQCPDDIELDTYPAAIYQILINLVMNSLVHGFEDNEAGQINIDVSVKNDSVSLVYSDNGCGMSEDVRSQIFDPFFTTRRGRGGTGLGMHIVFNLVTQALKGQIEVSSTLGKGTSIAIVFPNSPSP
ncbi:MAG: GAF domain-containing protein [Arenimonas sp.]